MDLYADLPLAKGAKASSALDADGKPKTSLSSTSSVWASTPLMVPQAAKNKSNDRPITNTSMLPSALAAGRGKSPTRSSISLAFKPASVARRTTTTITQVFKKKNEQEKVRPTGGGLGYVAATEVKVLSVQQQQQEKVRPTGGGLGYVAATEVKVTSVQQQQQEKVRPTGGGLGYVAATEVKVTSVQQQQEEKKEDVDVAVDAVDAVGGHFFQATYRDEYHPARPNSYEAYCKEQEDRKKMEQVKKELSRRQREQEREGKLEREQLVKDLAEGRAPTMQLPVPAGRGRGMTMPAWMRKKIEENAAVSASQPESEHDAYSESELKTADINETASKGQFEDAAEPRRGLGFFNKGLGFSSSSGTSSLAESSGFSRTTVVESNAQSRGSNVNASRYGKNDIPSEEPQRHAPLLDEFGREIRPESKRKYEENQRGDQRRMNSSNYKNEDHQRYKSNENHRSSEKRRRTSGWDSRSPGRTSSTSRVVLLQNMVGPGEVDDELQDEVKGECSGKYGPVTKCIIYEVTGRVSPEEAVRIFVQFKNAGDATQALTGLNGRFFGGRKVKAVYYDEGKFDGMDLTSQ